MRGTISQMKYDDFVYTRMMQAKKTKRLETMLRDAIRHFPELHGESISVGYTKRLGEAEIRRLLIRLNPRKLSYYVIGHELTHLVQGLKDRLGDHAIPKGEIACDIWTIARSDLFLDEPPGYLDVGRRVLLNWTSHRNRVRSLCIEAIEKRKIRRTYIQWLTAEIRSSSQ
ncbi:MAG TPA: hypothetical protein EYN74_05645 [Nitrospirales bacterium]|nr:hypothetical protein [Nitrospirales bacterium]HIN32756.1 hypothetical protein [Nitrospirales bacterium]